MLTIFCNPRPFTGEFDLIQRNAIRSWTRLKGPCQIILFNDEENTTEAVARELGVEFVGSVAANEFGTPLLDDVLARTKRMARFDLLAQVNADIVLFQDFVDTLAALHRGMAGREFFAIGRRWNLHLSGAIDFAPGWEAALRRRARTDGALHGPSGLDYWVFPRSTAFDPPPFCVGRPGMDSWLVFRSKQLGIPVLDATEGVMIVHQEHGYPKKRAAHFEEECSRNIRLAGGRSNLMTLRDADWRVGASGELERPPWKYRVLAGLGRFRAWRALLAAKRRLNRRLQGSSVTERKPRPAGAAAPSGGT